jgi:hypothetical protein
MPDVAIRIINDREIIQAIQSSPELFEKNLKREFGKVAGELRKDTLQELSKHQKSKWILEKAVTVKVRGSMKRGFISVRQGLSRSVKVPGKVQPNEYGYLIEHGNQQEKSREPRPFLEPDRERFIDSGTGESAVERAIAQTIEQFNQG